MTDPSTKIVQQHVVRGLHRGRFTDGFAEPATAEYDSLPVAEQLRICRIRAGLESDDQQTGGAFRIAGPSTYAGE